jgi:rhodanese-related sulfurtransferase
MKKLFILFLIISCVQNFPVVEKVEKEIFLQLIKKKYPLIDLRTPEEFVKGHIENALNIDFNSSDFSAQISNLNKEHYFLIYCSAGGRSNKAASLMESLGFKKVYELKGGYRNW